MGQPNHLSQMVLSGDPAVHTVPLSHRRHDAVADQTGVSPGGQTQVESLTTQYHDEGEEGKNKKIQ